MSIEKELTERLKEAMRNRRTDEVNVIRMVKSFAQKEKTSADFSGDTDDDFWQMVIGKYVKQQKKAIDEFQSLGSGEQQVDGLKFEVEYLKPFLPEKLSKEETIRLVDAAIDETGAAGMKMMGKVMGHIMKNHKDEVDAALVKELVRSRLS